MEAGDGKLAFSLIRKENSDMKKLLVGWVVGASLAAPFAALAADVTLIKSDTDKEKIDGKEVSMFSYWKDGVHWSNGKVPSPENDYFVTDGSYSLYAENSESAGATNVFKGNSLTFGIPGQTKDDTKVVPKFIVWGPGGSDWKRNFRAVRVDKMTAYGIDFYCQNTGFGKFCGDLTLLNGLEQNERFLFSGYGHNADGQVRGWVVDGTIHGTAKERIFFRNRANLKSYPNARAPFYLTGDFSDFKGIFAVYGTNAFVALNGPKVCVAHGKYKNDAFCMHTEAAVSIYPDCVQNTNFAIRIWSKDVGKRNIYIETDDESGDFDLWLPIESGDASQSTTFRTRAKTPKTITLRNFLKNFKGTIVIESGTVVFTDDVTLPTDSLRVLVKGSGRIASTRATGFDGLSLTFEGGGGYYMPTTTVPYDGTTSTPVDMTTGYPADFWKNVGKPLDFKLSQALAYPLNDTQTVALARLPKGVVTAADFTDSTAKSLYDLPHTWFAVESGAEYDTLKLVVKPMITRTGGDVYRPLDSATTYSRATEKWTDVPVWSDGLAAHPGADYIHAKQGDDVEIWSYYTSHDATEHFVGDSLYLSTIFMMKSREVVFPPTTFDLKEPFRPIGGSPMMQTFSGGPYTVVQDSILTKATLDKGKMYCFTVNADLIGAESCTWTLRSDTNLLSECYLNGDNSGYLGKFYLRCNRPNDNPTNALVIAFADKNSLGGPRSGGITWNAQDLAGASLLRPLKSMTYDTKNRGFALNGTGGGFDVPEGVDFTMATRLQPNGDGSDGLKTLFKEGPGNFSMTVNSVFGSYGTNWLDRVNNLIVVHGGTIQARAKTGFEKHRIEFANGTGFRVDPAATGDVATYGVYKPHAVETLGAGDRIVVKPATVPEGDDVFTFGATVVTLAADHADITALFKAAHVSGFRGTVVRDAETLKSENLVRYVANWERTGAVLILR